MGFPAPPPRWGSFLARCSPQQAVRPFPHCPPEDLQTHKCRNRPVVSTCSAPGAVPGTGDAAGSRGSALVGIPRLCLWQVGPPDPPGMCRLPWPSFHRVQSGVIPRCPASNGRAGSGFSSSPVPFCSLITPGRAPCPLHAPRQGTRALGEQACRSPGLPLLTFCLSLCVPAALTPTSHGSCT